MTWPGETDNQRENPEAIEAIREADPFAKLEPGDSVWMGDVCIYDDNLPEAWTREYRLIEKGPEFLKVERVPRDAFSPYTLARKYLHPTRRAALRANHAEMLGYLEQLRKACDEIAAEIEAEPKDRSSPDRHQPPFDITGNVG